MQLPGRLPLVLLFLVALVACEATTAQEPTATDTQAFKPTTTAFSTPTKTPEPTATVTEAPTETTTPTPEPTQTPTPEPTQIPTSPPPSTATEPPPADELAILSFTVEVEDIPTGKRLTFTWQTTGAVRATVWSGTRRRFPDAWSVPPNGTLTVELSTTYYRDPSMFLTAYDAEDNYVSSQSVTVPWPCTYDYFFETQSDVCPSVAATNTSAAEQPFQGGRMIWLEQVQAGGAVMQKQLLVFYDDGKYEQYEDTWTDAEPESDPAIVPPAGLHQPVRGFGKLWRENPSVRDRLGWATTPEQGFDTEWQQQIRESIPSVAFVRRLDGQVIQIDGWGWRTGGSWKLVTP